MKKRSALFLLTVFLLHSSLTAQYYNGFRPDRNHDSIRFQNNLYSKIWIDPRLDSALVDVTFDLAISYDFLQFIKLDTVYQAKYDLTVSFSGKQGGISRSKISSRSVSVRNFRETNSRNRLSVENFSFVMPPGNYTVYLELDDKNASTPYTMKQDITIPDIQKETLFSSDILFFPGSIDTVDRTLRLNPIPRPILSQSQPMLTGVMYILSNQVPHDIRIYKKIASMSGHVISQDTTLYTLKTRKYLYRYQLPEDLPFGQYKLQITVDDGTVIHTSASEFSVQWGKHSSLMPDLEMSIELLKYLVPNDKWNAVKEMVPDSQRVFLHTFWQSKDDDPSTPENPLEEEFYRRVAYADYNFTARNSSIPGWKTDRGKIYILYGPPSRVEKPTRMVQGTQDYELWIYQMLDKKFLFIDKNGIGDFILYSEE